MCLSLAVLTFGIQGLAGTAVRDATGALPPTGVVGPGTLDPGVPATAPSAATAAASAFTADALALVAFTRSTVETTSKEGGGELNVASAGMKRPPLGSLMAPLESLVPSSPFGLRISPLTLEAGEFHWGQDYAAACGTRVYSADAGVVRAVGWHPWGGGNRVEIDHGNGLITTYNHLEAIAVKKGDSVRVGEVIARVGSTGSSTGCHLHFETILNGSHTDPLRWAMIPIRQVDPLGPLAMTSYAPEADKASNAGLGWAIPVRTDLTHVVAGGDQERTVAAVAASSPPASAAAIKVAAAAPPASQSAPSASPTPSAPPTASPTASATPSPTPTETPAAPPSEPATVTPSPTAPSVTPPPSPTPPPAEPALPTTPPAEPAPPTAPPAADTPAPGPDPAAPDPAVPAAAPPAAPAIASLTPPAAVQPPQTVAPVPATTPAPAATGPATDPATGAATDPATAPLP
ncbi:M23 family metallopeptidase [Pseudarthrobacter sp. H2]|uniref:M23 family metallopeptidase n=1 Tax=Pseudarthrobacter sp. H2 TaxID=3418415 RepID=UPI003CE9B075